MLYVRNGHQLKTDKLHHSGKNVTLYRHIEVWFYIFCEITIMLNASGKVQRIYFENNVDSWFHSPIESQN